MQIIQNRNFKTNFLVTNYLKLILKIKKIKNFSIIITKLSKTKN